MSTSVSQADDLPCCGTFLLHQGIQRRIALTIIQDGRTDVQWTDVHALTIGCVRNTRQRKEVEGDSSILSLNAAVVPCVQQLEDTRYSYSMSVINVLYAIACPSVCLSVTRVDQSNTVEVCRISFVKRMFPLSAGVKQLVPRWQPHRHSGLANLWKPSPSHPILL